MSLLSTELPACLPEILPLDELLAAQLGRPLSGPADVHIQFQWPPRSSPPSAGRWVVQQPWEYGSLPRAWSDFMSRQVDEVWVPTHFVRDCYVQSGLEAERVQVVPRGVDAARFHPGVPPRTLRTHKRFKFLFVGGTIPRKGIDILLEAYTRTFTRRDDVCLIVKDMGIRTFYQGQTAEERIARIQADANAPEIEYLSTNLDEGALPGLYTACDCLVHPYRGEGFGNSIAEAMACGLATVVTGYGAALDYCDEHTSYLVPARILRFPEKRVGDLETVDYPWVAEPDVRALQGLLKHVIAHPDEARARGQAGRERIHTAFTWEHALDAAQARLRVLCQGPVRRTTIVKTVPVPEFSHTTPSVMTLVSADAVGAESRRQRVSLCMIVKNEENNLPSCLSSVADLVDEIIIVDTGSRDRTKEIAAQHGARVIDFLWCGSFAAARNAGLEHATGDWIFWLDGDECLDESNRQRFRALKESLKPEGAAYFMKQQSQSRPTGAAHNTVDQIRLFRRHPHVRWSYRVHEQILPTVKPLH
jgi:glycosyltransferase involved in cell wall biosynthesis